MKKYIMCSLLVFFGVLTTKAQDISKKEVPSLILNNFQNSFPKAKDIEWDKKRDHYKVEFEIGYINNDHSAWYSNEGQLLRHKEEISKRDLPDAVYEIIKKDYQWYMITDVERITEDQEITYKVELKSFTEEWEIIYDKSGKVLHKKRD